MGAVFSASLAFVLTYFPTGPSDLIHSCKWLLCCAYLRLRGPEQRLVPYDMESSDPFKTGFLPTELEVQLESPLPESSLCTSSDEIFFYGVNSGPESLFVRVARGARGEAEARIRLALSGGRTLVLRETSGFQQAAGDDRAFSCGGLLVRYLAPMKTWRVFFNGLLSETNEDSSSEKMVHVKIALTWRASSDVFDFISDIDKHSLCSGLSNVKWSGFAPPLEKFNKIMNCYAQAGIMTGTVSVEGEEAEKKLYLFGERMRFLGDTSLTSGTEFLHIMGQTSKNGRIVHLIEVSRPNVVENLTFGFVVQPTGRMVRLSRSSLVVGDQTSEGADGSNLLARFRVDGQDSELRGQCVGTQTDTRNQTGWEGRLTVDRIDFRLDGVAGSGLLVKGIIQQSAKRTLQCKPDVTSKREAPAVVHFTDAICRDPEVTGGKGSSLGKLTELSKEFRNFVVPEGVVVTTTSYSAFLTENILKKIEDLECVLYGKVAGDIKEMCQRVSEEITSSPFPHHVECAVEEAIRKAFPDQRHEVKFAVRSSATGEDTEQMSAAGQMDTFLGVIGLDQIILSIKKCWASQFGYIAVQYKRQNGQVINSPMAVVVQRMVPCDVAGVIFTCDPLTGNPQHLSLTANYGLGESVVSGSEEPDTIVLKRMDEEELQITDKIIGAKGRRIVIKEDGGTTEEDVSSDERRSCCLSDEMALRLGHVAVKIEKSYRSRRDIEWGFWNNNLYVFQSRPVTSGTAETDFEIEHEFDGPMRIENEYFTVCNVGEVMPGASSPLGHDVLMKYFNIIFQSSNFVSWQHETRSKYFPKGMMSMYNHTMFYMNDLFEAAMDDEDQVKMAAIGLFGRFIEEGEMLDIARERHRSTVPHLTLRHKLHLSLKKASTLKRIIFHYEDWLTKAQSLFKGYHIPVETLQTSRKLFYYLMNSCADIKEAMGAHMVCSEASSAWNVIIFAVLKNARGEIDADVYRDFSHLLTTSSDVESADVPAAVENLAFHIAKDITPEDFKAMTPDETKEWLQTTTSLSGNKYREFLIKHGHRCLKEFDMRSQTWGTNPQTLIKLLQNLVGNAKNPAQKKEKTFKEIITSLKINLGFKSRLFLRFAIPRSRKAVQNRELSKSLLIRCLDEWRKGYHHLSRLMVSEGRIPDADLLFFMTLPEIQELLETRSPRIIAKAGHRRRRQPTLDAYIFPEIMRGFPEPVNMNDSTMVSSDENFSMKGIPVSQGVAKGYVRVALTLEEASELKPGEILLTYSTDIGWSPYFPMLAGVVTELGGLISHGAVVSREYGIPCIAGLHGGTRQFQTGDYVLLDGNKGVLQRIAKPES